MRSNFGKVPKTAGNGAGQGVSSHPAAAPAADPKTANSAGTVPFPPVDPRVQSILDTRPPTGQTVREKLDADAPAYLTKAAQDHYNLQKQNGEQPDAVSRFYLNTLARDMAKNGIEHERVEADKMAGVFNLDQIEKNIEEASKDPAFLAWAAEQQANSIQNTVDANSDIAKLVQPYLQEGENHVNALRRMQSDYMRSQEFADGVALAETQEDGKALVNDGMKTLSSLGLGEKEMLDVGNTLAENIRSTYAPEAPKAVIDPQTSKPVQTADGNSMAILPDGTIIGMGSDGKVVADKQGHAYVYNADGTARLDAGGRYVQYDARAKAAYADYDGTRYMVDAGGKGRVDAQGRPLAIDNKGGVAVALGNNGKAVTNQAGHKLVFNPDTGKAVVDPEYGNAVVVDPKTGAVVQADNAGRIVAGENGDPYAADRISGKFVVDAQGRHVQISKDNIAPGILPGYVVDQNSTRVVVSPANGKPVLDPASGKTVILAPGTNVPQVVPLDAHGAPKLAADGKGIVYDESGNTVVPNERKGLNWLVDANGNYTTDANGNYIGVDSELGLAAPAGGNGFIRNASGLVPLWDIEANAPMTTKDGNPVVADDDGNLLLATPQGSTVVEEKTGLPYLFDPKTKETIANPDTGRKILLDKSGLPVEYNADDGYKYLINPETNTTVRTADGHAITTDDNGVPYAVRQDGSAVRNPDTGNTIVYGTDGLPATEHATGYPLEITSSGNAHVIDPKTKEPMAERDPDTGGYQLFNKDGSRATNPDTGNPIQMAPDTRMRIEIDPGTNRPVTDAMGNPLVIGADNRPMKTPEGNAVVADFKTGLPVSADANGKLIVDAASMLPVVVHAETGVPLADPETKAPVVADPESRRPVQVGADGRINTDPLTSTPVAIDTGTGAQVKGPDGTLAVNDPRTGLPVCYDKESKLFTVIDPGTGKVLTDPKTGAKTVVDAGSGMSFNVLPDAQGNHIIVDENGEPVKDDNGNQPYFDKDTGAVVMVNDKGEAVDPRTGKAPEKFDPKDLVHTTPLLLLGPPAIAVIASGKKKDTSPAFPDDDEILPDPVRSPETEDYGLPGPSGTQPAPMEAPWEAPGYKMTAAEREAFIEQWNKEFPDGPLSYDTYSNRVQEIKRLNPALQDIPDAELAAVAFYTDGTWWKDMNDALRYRDPYLLNMFDLHIKATSSGLTHLREAGFEYRGPAIRNIDLTDDQFSSSFVEGGTYSNRQFMSSSTDNIYVYRNTRVKVNFLTGVDIRIVSMIPHEGEVIGQPPGEFAVSKARPAGSRGGIGSAFRIRKINKVTLDEIPRGGSPDVRAPVTSIASRNWISVARTLGRFALEGLDILGGGAQIAFGGIQIHDGIRDNDPYEIASGSVNVAGGAASVAASIASLAGSVAAAPLAVAGIVFGGIAGIIDFVGGLDDDEQFADRLDKDFGPLGILQEGWRQKAQEAYKDGNEKYMGPNYTA